MYLHEDIKKAIEDKSLTFYIQPQCRPTNGAVIGGEALARIIMPGGEVISPGAHIETLEKEGSVAILDKQIWKNVCKWIKANKDNGIPVLPVSINISRYDFELFDVHAYLNALVDSNDISRNDLCLEITETTCAQNFDNMKKQLDSLKEEGFSIHLDDFGSGFSSLNVLDQLPVDAIKLDMGFVRKDTCLSEKNLSILKTIIEMAKAIGAKLIAEGIENKQQAKALYELGINCMQGFYFYEPMPQERYERIIIATPQD